MLILPIYFLKNCIDLLYHLQNQLKYNFGTLFTGVSVLKNLKIVEMLLGHFFLKVHQYVEKNKNVPILVWLFSLCVFIYHFYNLMLVLFIHSFTLLQGYSICHRCDVIDNHTLIGIRIRAILDILHTPISTLIFVVNTRSYAKYCKFNQSKLLNCLFFCICL
jgi:hypothetical protein